MTPHFYTKNHEAVDTVFFAVVPDSFMQRDPGDGNRRPASSVTGEWSDITDTPLFAPCDRWSF